MQQTSYHEITPHNFDNQQTLDTRNKNDSTVYFVVTFLNIHFDCNEIEKVGME